MDNTIEILGQKFSYPTTWQGTTAIFFVCLCVSFLAWTLEPSQISAYVNGLSPQDNKITEEKLISVNEKLDKEVISLRAEVLRLTKLTTLDEADKKKIIKKVDAGKKAISNKYNELIAVQEVQRDKLGTIISNTGSNQQQQVLSVERDRLIRNIDQYQQQQAQQQK